MVLKIFGLISILNFKSMASSIRLLYKSSNVAGNGLNFVYRSARLDLRKTFWDHNVIDRNVTNLAFDNTEGKGSSNVKDLLDNAATFENVKDPSSEWSTSPYPKGTISPRLQSRHSLRPRIDPRETSIILFPGEGSQYVGMGHCLLKYPGVRDIFEVASAILKYDALALCLKGPKSKLDDMKYAQVAVMVCSFAALEKLKEDRPSSVNSCIATAGFGVGELTALTFAGAISFERAIRLAQLRGQAMDVTASTDDMGMITVYYKASTKFHEVLMRARDFAAAEGVEQPICEVSNYLFPHCKVIAGHIKCLEFIEKNYKELELKNVRLLNARGAPNTTLMEPAGYIFRKYLLRSNIKEPVITVHSTVDGKPYIDEKEIVKKLSKQLWKPVRWEQMMHILYERPAGSNFPKTFECGPGSSLKNILKMVNAKAYDSCESVVVDDMS